MTIRIVLLSGGIGERLWPLSTGLKSKQFLPMYENESGDRESMVQRLWRQLKQTQVAEFSYISTCAEQKRHIVEQIGNDVPLIIEPERRNTFSAVALAACYLHTVAGASIDDTVCVIPVDIQMDLTFFHKLVETSAILQEKEANLVLIGVHPTYPSDQFGYIVPDLKGAEVFAGKTYCKVGHFVEKPTRTAAEKLILDHALWNCGVFTFSLRYMLDMLSHKGMPVEYEKMVAFYNQMPKTSFDYEVVEKENRTYVIAYEERWKDVGTWSALIEDMKSSLTGKGFCENCHNTHLINETGLNVLLIGLTDLIVVVSDNGILISDKSVSNRVKELQGRLEQYRGE